MKMVDTLVDPQPVLTDTLLQLAKWIQNHSVANLNQCINLMLLPGIKQFADAYYSIAEPIGDASLTVLQKKLLAVLQSKQKLRGRQIDRLITETDWRLQARRLVQKGYLSSESFLPRPSLHGRMVKKVQYAWNESSIDYNIAPFKSSSTQRSQVRIQLMQYLAVHPEPLDLQWVRAQVDGEIVTSDLEALVDAGMLAVWETDLIRDPLENMTEDAYIRHELTQPQQTAWIEIKSQIDLAKSGQSPTPIFLFGVTGSGKTEIYLRAAEETLAQGKQVIWLVPEISLTPQTVGRIMYRFPGQVGLVHSRLTMGERFDTWQRARHGKISIITGARSALFTPLQNVGLIVIDEAHDASYFQDRR